jgi:cellobiose phosphorylase
LGLHLDVDKLRFAPCLPAGWPFFKIHYRYRETFYHITFRNNGAGKAVTRILLDGNEQPDKCVPLIDDRNDHDVEVEVS